MAEMLHALGLLRSENQSLRSKWNLGRLQILRSCGNLSFEVGLSRPAYLRDLDRPRVPDGSRSRRVVAQDDEINSFSRVTAIIHENNIRTKMLIDKLMQSDEK